MLVLNGPATDQSAMLHFLASTYLPERLTTLLYLIPSDSPESGQFPVNKLRNLGIRNIVGTHFQVLDMDLWPVTHLYDTLMALPASITHSPTAAVILPVFFFDRKRVLQRCDSLRTCMQM